MKIRVAVFLALSSLTLLFAASAWGGETCLTSSCHADIAAIKMPHAPVKEGDCLSCHVKKGKEHPVKGVKTFELAAKGGALCKSCHDGMGKKKNQHAPVKEGDCLACHKAHGTSERFLLEVGDDRTPLCLGCHDEKSFKQPFMHGPAAVGSCNECHEPHESDLKGLLKDSVRNLCLKCHTDFVQPLKESPVVHPPVKNDPCTACHNAHGSQVAMFLNKKMPDLCTGCHTKMGKKLAGVTVPHKPVKEGNCGSCHSTHFSKSKGLLPFDEKTTCLSCHDNDKLGTPPLKNIKKEIEGKKYLHGPIKKGSCKACHDPHGSQHFRMGGGDYPSALYVPYKDGGYAFCLKCHEKNLLAYAETSIYTNFRNGKRNLHYVHVANLRKGRTCRVCHAAHASSGEKLINNDGASFGDWKIPINFKMTSTGGSCAPGCHRKFNYDRNKPETYSK